MNDAWQAANRVIEKLEENEYEAVIVGGAVRDFLLQKKANDVDVATSALPEQVKAIFQKTVDVGIEHGTILVLGFEEPIEVTTFRTEGTYSDHRRPDAVQFVRSLPEDLKRRDFTINAMAVRPDGTIVDLYGGQDDLQAQVLRAVGNPVERFTEDALRIIRGIRFSAQLNFLIEEKTALAMKETAYILPNMAVERVKAELDKIFISASPDNAFKHFEELTVSQQLPGDFTFERQWSTFEQVDEAMIGWAYWCYLQQSNDVLTSYKCSNNEKLFVKRTRRCLAILERDKPSKMELFELEESYWLAAFHCYEAFHNDKHPLSEQILAERAALPIQDVHQLAITGKDLMAWTEQKGGPWLKEALQTILQHVVNGELSNDATVIKSWYEQK